jgi:hypothetical protein
MLALDRNGEDLLAAELTSFDRVHAWGNLN